MSERAVVIAIVVFAVLLAVDFVLVIFNWW